MCIISTTSCAFSAAQIIPMLQDTENWQLAAVRVPAAPACCCAACRRCWALAFQARHRGRLGWRLCSARHGVRAPCLPPADRCGQVQHAPDALRTRLRQGLWQPVAALHCWAARVCSSVCLLESFCVKVKVVDFEVRKSFLESSIMLNRATISELLSFVGRPSGALRICLLHLARSASARLFQLALADFSRRSISPSRDTSYAPPPTVQVE